MRANVTLALKYVFCDGLNNNFLVSIVVKEKKKALVELRISVLSVVEIQGSAKRCVMF